MHAVGQRHLATVGHLVGLVVVLSLSGLAIWNSRELGQISADFAAHLDAPHLRQLETAQTVAGLIAMASLMAMMSYAVSVLAFRAYEHKSLAASEQFHAVLEAAPDGVVLVDKLGRIQSVNAAAERLFGYTRAELLGQELEILVPPELRSDHRKQRRGYALNPRARSVMAGRNVPALRKDGSIVQVEINLNMVVCNHVSLYMAMVRDATERVHAQQALADYAHEVEDLYDHSPCGYHSLDEAGLVVRINDTELGWLGRTRHEVLGRPFTAWLAPASKVVFESHHRHFVLQGQTDAVELELMCSEGRVRVVLAQSTAVRAGDGHLLRSRTTLVDITERRQVERERDRLIAELQDALSQVKRLSGLLPMCAWCKRIRDEQGAYQPLESYITSHSDAQFSHGMCPECARRFDVA